MPPVQESSPLWNNYVMRHIRQFDLLHRESTGKYGKMADGIGLSPFRYNENIYHYMCIWYATISELSIRRLKWTPVTTLY